MGKRWLYGVLLTRGIFMVVGGLLVAIGISDNPFDNPKYAPGEACAMVERVYKWSESSLSPLQEEYLGQGVWEVRSQNDAIFRVYKQTDTVEIYNYQARYVLRQLLLSPEDYLGRLDSKEPREDIIIDEHGRLKLVEPSPETLAEAERLFREAG